MNIKRITIFLSLLLLISCMCFPVSAQDEYDIPAILKRIIDEGIYYKDYEDITAKVLFDGTSYETSITAIQKIIDSNIF